MKGLPVLPSLALGFGLPSLAHAYPVEDLLATGDPGNRIDVVILGDGYRAGDQAKLSADAEALTEAFFSDAPLSSYRGFFNVRLVHVESVDNGADHGSYGEERDTALGAHFDCYDSDRLLCVDEDAALLVAADHVPEFDQVLVIVNDPRYGGSGGQVVVASTGQYADEVARHEMGHGLADLADEYDLPYPDFPACGDDCPEPNVTPHTELADIKWNAWLEPATPLPTPETNAYDDVVGAFEGARYQELGLFRPRLDCKMRTWGSPYCEVCSEAVIVATYDKVSPIDAFDPQSDVVLGAGEMVTLSVTHVAPEPDTVVLTWTLDSTVLASASSTLTLSADALAVGTHAVEVRVEDATTMVRSDPSDLLMAQRSWSVHVTGHSASTGTSSGETGGDDGTVESGEASGVASSTGEGATSDVSTSDVSTSDVSTSNGDGETSTANDSGAANSGAEGCGCTSGTPSWLALALTLPLTRRRRSAARGALGRP